ncbi:MAG: hypothetical protein ACRER2_00305 [Methylococcales bacterium]
MIAAGISGNARACQRATHALQLQAGNADFRARSNPLIPAWRTVALETA